MAAPNLEWGGHRNGRIPTSVLVDIGGGKMLQRDAAAAFGQFAAAFRARWGDRLYLAADQDAYRDYARQKYMRDHPELYPHAKAAPGTSIHGWARSVDVSGYGAKGSQRHNWLVENAPRFGWSWDYGRALGEPWHFDYIGPTTTTAGTAIPMEVLMSMFDDFVLDQSGGGYWFSPNYGARKVTSLQAEAMTAVKQFQRDGTRVPFNYIATLSEMVRAAALEWLVPTLDAAIAPQFTDEQLATLHEAIAAVPASVLDEQAKRLGNG